MKKITRLALIAHHEIVRCGLSRLINNYPGYHVAFESGDNEAFEHFANRHPPDLVLLDISLQQMSGLEVLKQIRRRFPDLPVLILSESALPGLYKNAMAAGANGYLLKHETPSELKRAIESVAEGKRYLCPLMTEKLASKRSNNNKDDWETNRLSPRQIEVVRCLALGMTVAETAANLGMKPKTVSCHRTQIFSKQGLRTTADLVLFALRSELIFLEDT